VLVAKFIAFVNKPGIPPLMIALLPELLDHIRLVPSTVFLAFWQRKPKKDGTPSSAISSYKVSWTAGKTAEPPTLFQGVFPPSFSLEEGLRVVGVVTMSFSADLARRLRLWPTYRIYLPPPKSL